MLTSNLNRTILVLVTAMLACGCSFVSAAAPTPEELLQQLDAYPHARQIAFSKKDVLDHEIGLGAIQKVRGEWRFKHSERLSGTLMRYTWQIVDGFTSAQVMATLLESITQGGGANLLFTCDGRACGQGVQWANRVFQERELYGREDLQRYRVYSLDEGDIYRLVVYSAERTEDRQYLHVDLLRIAQ
jgi:Domain of unknown function (DUF4892)